ncbi:MAG: nitronate monooxygenase [Bdellovibrionaceae bacterium]|nr:nitronate monooxygenase [Pseudobdellovibrionaceae bacterium]
MTAKFDLIETLKLSGPLVQAPLGGGPGTAELTAAVSNAGALGSLGAAYLRVEDLEREILKTKRLTRKSFAVNLFIPSTPPVLDPAKSAAALEGTQKYRDQLSLSKPMIQMSPFADFGAQMKIVLKHRPAVFSFVFGLLPEEFVRECKSAKILLIGTATNLEEAQGLAKSGVDAITAQGFEAGGHRGMFSPNDTDSKMTTQELTKKLSQSVDIPIIAAGGIMDGAGIAAALSWGAQAAQLGTSFMLCPEAGTAEAYRTALMSKKAEAPRMTRVFSGRWARGLENKFMREMEQNPEAVLPWPIQNAFTRDLRQKSAQNGSPDFLSLWAGSGVSKIREMKAAQLVETLFSELSKASI